MHEFDKCRFCYYHEPKISRLDKCTYSQHNSYGYGCLDHAAFHLDVRKVIDKAKLYKISVTDVLNIMREVTK